MQPNSKKYYTKKGSASYSLSILNAQEAETSTGTFIHVISSSYTHLICFYDCFFFFQSIIIGH